ncbi:carboxylesterase/lipase family protein [Fretibacter rubidus]|uniref:carboxylesterase/lipase family protein n=1 Tax=Fretibacter rubidus TaxID=570162 RepID=UPI003529DE31
MRTVKKLCLVLCAGVFMVGCESVPQNNDVMRWQVKTSSGVISGKQSANGTEAFLGIPYAAAPIGDLRWRAPQPTEPWRGVFPATEYGSDCAQIPFPSDAAPLGTEPSEDCLFMNVWRPAGAKAGDDLPVMVWIHGGGFVNGGASPDTYSGEYIADQGIIFASFNYRLGRFGFFAHPALQEDATDAEVSGNFALLDQVTALTWIKDNISDFGGDPDRVTLIGESAGGMSVHAMLTSPMAKDLVHGVVIQSGADGDISGENADSAKQKAINFAQSKGIHGEGVSAATALRELSVEDVIDGFNLDTMFTAMFRPDLDLPPGPGSMVADRNVAVNMIDEYRRGTFPKVPVMIGPTSDDIGGPEGFMIKGALDVADAMAEAGAPVWHYTYDYVAESIRTPETKGAAHASEIPFFFGTVNEKYGAETDDKDRRASETVLNYLVNFTKSGNPNGEGLVEWKRFNEQRSSLIFDMDGGATPTSK